MQPLGIKGPRLHDYGGDIAKGWYVSFSMTNPDNPMERKRFALRNYINHEDTVLKRREAGRALLDLVNRCLDRGWNPFQMNMYEFIQEGKKVDPDHEMGFIEAMRFGLKEKEGRIVPKTYSEYENNIGYAEKAAKKLGILDKPVSRIKMADAKRLLKQLQKDRSWTAHAYNKAQGIFSCLMSELLEYEFIEYNPFFKIKRQTWIEREVNRPPTDEEQELIRATLYQKHYPFFVFVIAIYHTGIRPKELLGLRIKDFKPDIQSFVLEPGDERTKTKKERVVPMNPHLWKHIEKMQLERYRPDWHIFSRGYVPGPDRLERKHATDKWRRIVKNKKRGLGIQVNMYAMKHKGADDKIMAGIDLDALKELYGHSSKYMTEKYARKVKQIYRTQIMDKSPEF